MSRIGRGFVFARDSKMPTEANPKELVKTVEVEHVFDDVRPQFANHFTVQHTLKGEFFVSLFQLVPPLVLGESDKERTEQLQKIAKVKANCVGQYMLSTDEVKRVIAALVENVRKFEKLVAETEGKA